MKSIRTHIAGLLMLTGLLSVKNNNVPAIAVQHLQTELLNNPQGIGTATPRLSWQTTSDQRNTFQQAYELLVASSVEKLAANEGDLWDTHKVLSDQSIMVGYAGKKLFSSTECYWKVRVWTNKGLSAWSQPAHWCEGLLNADDWKARWIGYDGSFPWDSVSKFSRLSARYFRKEFSSDKSIAKATVYIIGLGHYELYINGEKIGNQVLAEAPTDYTRSVMYNTYDVTANLQQGANTIGVILGNGRFFTMRPKYKPQKIKEFGFPKMLLQLEITYKDGSKQTIISDDSWKFTADGPIRTNNEYDGEEYDATKELGNWDKTGYNDKKWLNPQMVAPPGGEVTAQMDEPIGVVDTIRPVSIKQLKPGTWIMDLGQNMAGWVKIKVRGNRGDKITLRYGETLKDDGELYLANLRDAKVTDVYTLKGGNAEEIWHPVFVFHGFRYVEMSGFSYTPALDSFTGEVVSDQMAVTGNISTSDTLLNQIYHNAFWSILSDYKGMPVDCPQRNERMPWLGDRAVGSLGESFVFDNENLYAKWLDDIQQAQKRDGAIPDVAPAYWNYYSDDLTWPATYILIADMLYTQFADKAPIEKHYASMKKWLSYMDQKYGQDGLMTKDKYGDWCVPPESVELIHTRDSSRTTNGVLIATAYYYRMLTLMQSFAKLLNKPADVQEFGVSALKTRNAFNEKFFDKKTFVYDNNTVTANLVPLFFGMTPEADKKAVFANIVNKIVNQEHSHISTGVIGTQWLMRGLTDFGRPDIALKIADNSDYPGWGYMVKRGATSTWELWNGDTANPAMNSRNHVMLLGDLIAWYYQCLAGIKAGAPGFKVIEMRPSTVGLDSVKASYGTPYGLVKSSWKKEGIVFNWRITIPANTKAIVYLPTAAINRIKENGAALSSDADVKVLNTAKGDVQVEIGSGDYQFSVEDYGK